MNTTEIAVESLKDEIKCNTFDQAHVQNFLTLVRKLLEIITNTAGNYSKKWYILKFFCDWSMHSKLEWKPAQNIILDLNISLSKYESNPSLEHIPQAFIKDLENMLRSQLKDFLQENNCDTKRCDNNILWGLFYYQLLMLLREYPIKNSKYEKIKGKSGLPFWISSFWIEKYSSKNYTETCEWHFDGDLIFCATIEPKNLKLNQRILRPNEYFLT